MKQYEAVIQAMQHNDGYATLGYLYQEVLKIQEARWETKTPHASIRRIVQTRDEIFKIKPGLWALEEFRDRLPAHILPTNQITQKETEIFDHSYYQGLIIEIGNLQGFDTYVPAQDKNRPFLHQTLGQIATQTQCPEFSYPNITRRAKTIDVIWFNERGLPSRLFEVEHTTNMQNSLLKFVDLQDFFTGFYIVADEARRKLYETKIQLSAFTPISDRVKFVDYERLLKFYESSYAANKYRF
jgi:hypothetical protein